MVHSPDLAAPCQPGVLEDGLRESGAAVLRGEPLAKRTWFGLGGPAEWLVTPPDIESLARVVLLCREYRVPMRVLGGGANLLVSDDGVPGVVVTLQGEAFTRTSITGESVAAGAGVYLPKLVNACAKAGLAGLEALAGIPGTLGGALRMNAGGKLGAIGGRVTSVTVMDPEGKVREFAASECGFAYRDSRLKEFIILSARLSLVRGDAAQLKDAVARFTREKSQAQPLRMPSAGCVFKNPAGQAAGALIDRCGLKGLRIGGAEVSPCHANFIVAHPGCRASDVESLIARIRGVVKETCDVDLDLEVIVWP